MKQNQKFKEKITLLYKMVIKVFTDGSCTKNGKKTAIGGIGVFFADNDPRNVSKSLNSFYSNQFPDENATKSTNNKAELSAILSALLVIKPCLEKNEKVMLYTDSMYSINCLTKWWSKWRANDWTNSSKKKISNYSLITKIVEEFILKYNDLIYFKHVRSHTVLAPGHSQKDFFEWYGNHEADRLATSFLD
jgi:ribonuclease HI